MNHCMIRPFMPVFERKYKTYLVASGFGQEGGYQMVKVEPGEFYPVCSISPTSIPNKVWPLVRMRKRRTGQLELINELEWN